MSVGNGNTAADSNLTRLPRTIATVKVELAADVTNELRLLFCIRVGVKKRGYVCFHGEEAITERAGLRQQATSPKLAKSKLICTK
ncbi:hypothetical protein NG99_01155 [Erwinia typographi]|uniref:Uncharacterized protein n=1 Tax=Erwinia typographi TaxID=371042 RepID=A0A0A3ZA60_9GAMM|nr:hypothetical protein NG99_01155 [Erwinia typographi]